MKTKKIKKILVIAHDHEGSYDVFKKLQNHFNDREFLLVIGERLYYKKTWPQSILHLIKKASILFVFSRFISLAKYKLKGKTLDTLCSSLNIPVIRTKDINSEEVLSKVKAFNPDVTLSVFTMQIFRKALIDIPKYKTINIHPGKLPEYRGLEPFFWAMVNNEDEIYVSAHYITEKLDDGKVIREEKFPLTQKYSISSLYNKCIEVSGSVLIKAVQDIDNDNVNVINKKGKSNYYPMPTRESVAKFLKSGGKF